MRDLLRRTPISCELLLVAVFCFVSFTARGFWFILFLLWSPSAFGTAAATMACIRTPPQRGHDVACRSSWKSAASRPRPRPVLQNCESRPTKAARRSKAAVAWFKLRWGYANSLRRQVLLPFGSGADQQRALVGENSRPRPCPELKKARRTARRASAEETKPALAAVAP